MVITVSYIPPRVYSRVFHPSDIKCHISTIAFVTFSARSGLLCGPGLVGAVVKASDLWSTG